MSKKQNFQTVFNIISNFSIVGARKKKSRATPLIFASGLYSPLTRIRGTTLENFGAKSSFFRRVGFQKACENCPPDFLGQRSGSSGEQTRQKRRHFSVSMQDLRIFKNALLKSAPYFKKNLFKKTSVKQEDIDYP